MANNEPISNEFCPSASILPERFRSISEPSVIPIISEDFNSVTEPVFFAILKEEQEESV